LGVFGTTEVISVFLLVEPALLACRFAGLSAFGFGTVFFYGVILWLDCVTIGSHSIF